MCVELKPAPYKGASEISKFASALLSVRVQQYTSLASSLSLPRVSERYWVSIRLLCLNHEDIRGDEAIVFEMRVIKSIFTSY